MGKVESKEVADEVRQYLVGHRETLAFTPRQVGAMEGSEERDVARLGCSRRPLAAVVEDRPS